MDERPAEVLSFDDVLHAVDQHVATDVKPTFRPPADEAAIDRIERTLGVPVPQYLKLLLLWHDGQEWNSPLRESDNFRLLSSQEIIESLEFFLDADEDYLKPWGRYWVPFLTNDAGDYAVVDASPGGKGEIVDYWHDMEDRDVTHASLAAWAAGLLEELKSDTAV